MRCVTADLEALVGRARLLCHRWSTSVSVGAAAAHRRAPPSKLLTALDARLLHEREWTCRFGAMLHDQEGRCAAWQLVWRRWLDVPDCSAIDVVPQ